MGAGMTIPDGFTQLRPFGGFHEVNGPLWYTRRGENVVVAMAVEPRHENAVSSLHGGMFLTLVDTAMTMAANRAAPKGQHTVTTSLTSDFLAPARAGDWIEAEARVLRAGRRLIVLDCHVRKDGADGQLLLRASGSFQVVGG